MSTINNDTRIIVKQTNKIIKGIDKVAIKIKKASDRLQSEAIDKTIFLNGNKSPFKTSSLVASEVDANLRKVINDANKDYKDFIIETHRYLKDNFTINLTKKDLKLISKKNSDLIDSLINNTDILKQDIQNILTQNLGKGISEKRLVQELKELYPAYSRNAGTIVNTGLGRLFTDINVSKFEDSGFKWYIWAGPDDSVTRETPCKHWVWHRFSADQLQTITATRMTLWNCRHSIIPIPDSDIEKYPMGDIKFA